MEITVVIQSIIGLVGVLGILLFLLFYSKSLKKAKAKTEVKSTANKGVPDLDTLRKIIKNKQTSAEKLKEALDIVLEHYGTIKKFDVYLEILIVICRHPNTNKSIILNFDKALEAKNPKYKHEINNAITQGLNSRGA